MASKVRKRILQSAFDVYAQKGYNGATSVVIAQSADVTEGSLYRLLQTMDNLEKEVAQEMFGRFDAKTGEAVFSGSDIVKSLRTAMNTYLEEANGAWLRLLFFTALERQQLVVK